MNPKHISLQCLGNIPFIIDSDITYVISVFVYMIVRLNQHSYACPAKIQPLEMRNLRYKNKYQKETQDYNLQ